MLAELGARPWNTRVAASLASGFQQAVSLATRGATTENTRVAARLATGLLQAVSLAKRGTTTRNTRVAALQATGFPPAMGMTKLPCLVCHGPRLLCSRLNSYGHTRAGLNKTLKNVGKLMKT